MCYLTSRSFVVCIGENGSSQQTERFCLRHSDCFTCEVPGAIVLYLNTRNSYSKCNSSIFSRGLKSQIGNKWLLIAYLKYLQIFVFINLTIKIELN